MNDKVMLAEPSPRQHHVESAAITLVIAGVLVLPLERLHTSGMLLLATLLMAFAAGRPFLSRAAGLYRPLAFLTAGILLVGLAVLLERQRRRLITQIRESTTVTPA